MQIGIGARTAALINPHTFKLLLYAILLASNAPATGQASQWQNIARTESHKVAIDTASVQLSDQGSLTVWLRYIPLNELKRREAAIVFGKSNYRLHREFYKVDCGENSAVLEFTDIIGPSGKRLDRLKGGGQPDAIIEGSVLGLTARQVCPDQEENPIDEEGTADTTIENPQSGEPLSDQIAQEVQQRITIAQQRTQTEPGNLESWVELGNAYYDADMPEQAINAYDHALALKADNIDVLNDQGAMFRQSGNIAQAVKNFEKVISIDPGNLESLYNLGYVHAFDLNDTVRALEIWRRYLVLDPSSETARQVRNFIKRYGK